MKAMIFAAGLGTRLRPLTNDRPKALVEFKGKTLLEHTIDKLKAAGVDALVVNVHHYADKVIDFLQAKDFGLDIAISDERDQLLDTGGGLRKAAPLLGNEPFFIHNVDIISDIDLKALMAAHMASGAMATLATRPTEAERYFMKNDENILCGWGNHRTGEEIVSRPAEVLHKLAFTGIHVVSTALLKYIAPEGPVSIIDAYLAAAKKEKILCFSCENNRWMDVGTPEALAEARTKFE